MARRKPPTVILRPSYCCCSLCPKPDESAAQRGLLQDRRRRHGAGCHNQPCLNHSDQGFCDVSDQASDVDSLTQVCAVLGVLVHLVNSSCPRDMLAVYKIRLETFWSEERFPKQYPQWRPPAQWSKTVGKFFILVSSRHLDFVFDRVHPPSRVSALPGKMTLAAVGQ